MGVYIGGVGVSVGGVGGGVADSIEAKPQRNVHQTNVMTGAE